MAELVVKTETEKMVAGERYFANAPELDEARRETREMLLQFNTTSERLVEQRLSLISKLFPKAGQGLFVTPPFRCDYGWNIITGDNVYFNFNCVILDGCPVTIGSNTLFGPSVQIYSACHPIDAVERRSGIEFGKPVTIGCDVWVGGASVICPGVTIGDRVVIGAGSVVTKDIPSDVVAVGNPCRVIRRLEPGEDPSQAERR
jgi:maltose O-acetyltransferase